MSIPSPRSELPTRVGITAVASVLADSVLSTDALQARVEATSHLTFPANIVRDITGITERRMATELEYPSTFAAQAGALALKRAGLTADDVDLLVFASASQDITEPATAHIVQVALGTTAHCFDVKNACNSFINGIDVARSLMLAGRARTALVVTGETPTRSLKWDVKDFDEAMLSLAGYTFGDAGAAVVLQAVPTGGILDIDTETHSEFWEVGGIWGGGSRHPRSIEHTYFSGDGSALRGVFEKVGNEIFTRLWERGFGWDDFSRVLVHQVTVPYIERFCAVTGAPADKIEITVDLLGNLASASLPLQLDHIFADLAPGEKVLLVGLGGGISLMTMVWEKA